MDLDAVVFGCQGGVLGVPLRHKQPCVIKKGRWVGWICGLFHAEI